MKATTYAKWDETRAKVRLRLLEPATLLRAEGVVLLALSVLAYYSTG